MPLSDAFRAAAKRATIPAMGTEHVGPLLYSLVLMLRPRSVVEIGSGLTTLYLAQGLADAQAEAAAERPAEPYLPGLTVFDTLTYRHSSARLVPSLLDELGLRALVHPIEHSFVGGVAHLPPSRLPIDLVWFDCDAARDNGTTFLREYWPHIRPDGGVLAMHSTLILLSRTLSGRPVRVPSPLLNEIRKRQADAGRRRRFEVFCLPERDKATQGDVTLVRRLGTLDAIREPEFDRDAASFGAAADFPQDL